MADEQQAEVTTVLDQVRAGDPGARERLVGLVYDELRRIAAGLMTHERDDHTLQPTALVHEAWIKLARQEDAHVADRAHFLALAATAMRRILVNHAEARRAHKRGGGGERVTLFEGASVFEERAEDLVALDEALERLAARDPQKARIVELRFFAGLTNEEAAEALAVSTRTVERGWRFARAWLAKELGATGSQDT